MSASPTVTYRALSPTGDPLWGQGQGNYLADLEAVALLLQTRLRLFVGEWWADLADGLPVFQVSPGASSILGGTLNIEQATLLIQARILATPYVTGIINLETSYSSTRQFLYSAVVQTQFGNVQVSNSASNS